MPNKFHSLLNWNACAGSNGYWQEERFPEKPPVALCWAGGEYENRNLEFFRAKVVEPYSLLHRKGQRWEVDSKIDRNILNNFDCFIGLKYMLERFTNTNHSWFLKRKHNSFYIEVFFFYFFNVSIAKGCQIGCTFNIGLFCTEDCMGMPPDGVRKRGFSWFTSNRSWVMSVNPTAYSFLRHKGGDPQWNLWLCSLGPPEFQKEDVFKLTSLKFP